MKGEENQAKDEDRKHQFVLRNGKRWKDPAASRVDLGIDHELKLRVLDMTAYGKKKHSGLEI